MGEREKITDDILIDFALADLKLWLQRGLDRLKGRTVYDEHGHATNAFACAEFADWDMRQKLDLIESANSDAVRILDLNHRMVECLNEALAQTGCDGDLCLYRWHETARLLVAEANEAIATHAVAALAGKGKGE